MKRICVIIGTLLGVLPWATVTSAPLSPAEQSSQNVNNNFSPAVQDAFVLLADTDNSNLVYYVPRRGAVAVQSPLSPSPIPRFQIFNRVPMYGIFAGMDLVSLGGSFSTTGDQGALKLLQAEAAQKGYTTSPAPARSATTLFLVGGYQLPDGRIDVNCTMKEEPFNGRTVRIPECFTRHSPSEPYYIDTNVMYKFVSLPALNKSVVSQDIPFQGTTGPAWTDPLRAIMAVGGQWDSTLTAQINWDIQTGSLTRQARFFINWETLFEQASAYAGVHYWCLADTDVQAFFRKLVECSNENACGVRPEFLQPDNTWGPKAPNDANFANIAQTLQRALEAEVFNRLARWTNSKLGPVSNRHYAVFTLRANYEKLISSVHEVRYLTWNPGPQDFQASTVLNISCLKDGFEQGKVTWNMDDAGCRALLGQP